MAERPTVVRTSEKRFPIKGLEIDPRAEGMGVIVTTGNNQRVSLGELLLYGPVTVEFKDGGKIQLENGKAPVYTTPPLDKPLYEVLGEMETINDQEKERPVFESLRLALQEQTAGKEAEEKQEAVRKAATLRVIGKAAPRVVQDVPE